MHTQLPVGGSHDTIFKKCPNMEVICYFTLLHRFIASPAAALLVIPYVDTVICSNVLNFAF